MKTITLNSRSPIGALIDAYLQGSSLADRPEAEREPIERDLRGMQAVYDDAEKAARMAVESRELTARGIKEAVKRAVSVATEALKAHEDRVRAVAADAAAMRQRAIAPPTGERDLEALLLEREVRDRLAGKDPLEIGVVYLAANEWEDWRTVSALENAPPSFRMLTAEQRETGEAMRLTRSPLAPVVAAAESTAFFYGSTAAAVHAELAKLAERYHVSADRGDERHTVNI